MSSNWFYSSNFQKPISSPQSQPENVKTAEQEVKQSFPLPDQVGEEAGTWTKVLKGKQTTRRGLRNVAVLKSNEKDFSTPSPPSGHNGSIPQSIERKSSSISLKRRPKPKPMKKRAKKILLPSKLK